MPQMLKGAVALVVTIALAACGGASAPASQGSASPAPASGTAATKPSGPSFLDALGSAKAASYKITYTITGTGSGQAMTGEQTWYVKPPKMRYDFALGAAGGGTTSLFIVESGTFLCTAVGAQKQCFTSGGPGAGAQANPGQQFDAQLRTRPDQFDSTYEGTKKIAGQDAQCWALKGKAAELAGAEYRTCYTAQGMLVLMQSTSAGLGFTMEAKSIGSVSDADFELPAKPTTY